MHAFPVPHNTVGSLELAMADYQRLACNCKSEALFCFFNNLITLQREENPQTVFEEMVEYTCVSLISSQIPKMVVKSEKE